MMCARCKKPIETPYRHEPGLGDVHKTCPKDTSQQSLLGDDNEPLVVDEDANYPDWS